MISNLSNKRDLAKFLDSLLLPRGLIRVKDDWYFDNQECISIIGLGKSFYGGQFDLGIDIFLKELRPDLLPFPPRQLCHFRGFVVGFLMPDENILKAALNLENSLSSSDRMDTITIAIDEYALPFITPLNSKQAIAQAYKIKEGFEAYCNLDLKLVLERDGYLSKEELKLDL